MRYLLYAVAILTMVPAAAAQSPGPASAEHDRGWVTVDFGTGFPSGYNVTANLGRKRVFQVGHHLGSGFLTTVRAVNVGFGHSWVSRWSRVAGFAGPAVSWGYGSSGFTTIGALANAQVIVTPVREIGIGVTIWGNLNAEQSVGGLGVMVVFEGNK